MPAPQEEETGASLNPQSFPPLPVCGLWARQTLPQCRRGPRSAEYGRVLPHAASVDTGPRSQRPRAGRPVSQRLLSHSVTSDSETPRAAACKAALSMGFPRPEYWSGVPVPSPGDLPDPGVEPASPHCRWDLCRWSHRERRVSDSPPETWGWEHSDSSGSTIWLWRETTASGSRRLRVPYSPSENRLLS